MSLFQYPKGKHRRGLKPRKFKNYGSYKRYLQHEFKRLCVYCRQPDSSAPNLNFGVDHYRPKSIPRFASLVADYENLYYCCAHCNSRKNAYWPIDEAKGPYVVNPCDHDMGKHLRFDAATSKICPRTPDGIHTEELLQLNEPATVQYRKSAALSLLLVDREIANLEQDLVDLAKRLRKGSLNQLQFSAAATDIDADLTSARALLESITGEMPAPRLPRQRNGIPLPF